MALWIDNDEGSYKWSRDLVQEAGAVCFWCEEQIRSIADPAIPKGWIHDDTGNSFCDVDTPADAVEKRGQEDRKEAEPNIGAAADALKDWQQEDMPELPNSVWSDLLSAAFSEVDWFEIAENYLSE